MITSRRRPSAPRLGLLALAACTLAVAVLVPGAVGAAGAAEGPASTWAPRAATYGQAVTHDVKITMSDGTVLVADVFRPAGDDGTPAPGRFPVILTQTPYNKTLPGTNFALPYLVERGYVQVIADVRGTGGSGGTWMPFQQREQRDGYELARWAVGQPWSDGRLALSGASYGAINQLLTAEQQPPGLKAIFPIVPSGDPYRDVYTAGGSIDSGFIPLWLGLVTGAGVLPPAYSPGDPQLAARTLVQHLGGALDFQVSQTGQTLLLGGDLAYDGPYFRSITALERIDKITVPTFVIGGEYDLFQRSEPKIFTALQHRGIPTRLVFGPWYHIGGALGQGMPAGVLPSYDVLMLRWFDHYVRGIADPTLSRDVAPVTYHQIGSGQWLRAPSFPPPGVQYRALRLGGTATPLADLGAGQAGAGTLGANGSGAPDTVPFLAVTGACSRATTQWTAGGAVGCDGDNRLGDLGGVGYDLPVTGAPLDLAGPLSARLWISSAAPDAAITVKVEDVAPDGHVDQITSGTQVLSLRALDTARTQWRGGYAVVPWHPMTRASQQPMPSNTPVPVDVEIFPTAARIAPGHRLRLTVSAADFPQHVPTAPSLLDSLGNLGGGLRLWHDAAHPSYLVVPKLA